MVLNMPPFLLVMRTNKDLYEKINLLLSCFLDVLLAFPFVIKPSHNWTQTWLKSLKKNHVLLVSYNVHVTAYLPNKLTQWKRSSAYFSKLASLSENLGSLASFLWGNDESTLIQDYSGTWSSHKTSMSIEISHSNVFAWGAVSNLFNTTVRSWISLQQIFIVSTAISSTRPRYLALIILDLGFFFAESRNSNFDPLLFCRI